MKKVRLGKTDLMVTRTSFGALPIQRVDKEEAKRILTAAYDAGINYFDTARGYSDSEEKLGYTFDTGMRKNIIISTKSGARDKKTLLEHLAVSLKNMNTDYVDILQLHNPGELPDPDDPESSYAGLLEAKKQGMIRHIGITNHRVALAEKAIASGLYETLQYPLCYLSSGADLDLVEKCRQADMGLIAMKALSGGLITNIPAAVAFMNGLETVVPIWGIQKLSELEQFIALEGNPPQLTDELQAAITQDKAELAGAFCRGCGYCLPCPAEIPIPMAARMKLLLHRSPWQRLVGEAWQANMAKIEKCTECGHCRDHCPYELDTPQLLKDNLAYYRDFVKEHTA